MKKSKWIILAGILLSAVTLVAVARSAGWWNRKKTHDLPDAREELKRLYALYMKADTSIYLSGVIDLYDEENTDQLKETTCFAFYRSGSSFYSQLGPSQFFGADSLLVTLDTLNKQVSLARMDRQAIKTSLYSPGSVFPFESFLADTSVFKVVLELTERDSKRFLTIKSELNPGIASSSLLYDPVSGIISESEIRWRKDELVFEETREEKCWLTKIRYQHHAGKRMNVSELIKRILVMKGEQITTTTAYAGYELSNAY
jgi:hypothetical protein